MSTPHRRVTIHDVAREAGVSVSTVSKVVNHRDGISPTTRVRVQEVIDRYGYGASVGARGLRGHRSGVLGVLINEFEPYSAEVLKGIAAACSGSGYELLAWSAAVGGDRTQAGWEQRLIAKLAGSLIDGAVLVTPSAAPVNAAGFPLVAVDPHDPSGPMPNVHADDLGGARLAVEHLVAMGHRSIAHLGGRADLASAQFRERGYREGMAAAGLPVDEAWVAAGDYTARGATAATHALLGLSPRPTAIFAANDVTALRVLAVATELGLSVPDDLSVVGFDNVPEAAMSVPGLTTVEQPMQEIGRRAFEELLAQLRSEPSATHSVKVPTRLVVRGTTAPRPR
ncbi:LacI family DNA-binding transcriptional regulator [Aestuariimicrobium soli]|uniref:LacI family DNA-binding transcriptional regulator n=1 Tax=Aestuariimicrobium soli TaxID=2035834 RepID=UPI003EB872A4